MAFTKRLEPTIRFSPREERLITSLRASGWTGSEALCSAVWGEARTKWPLNARKMVTGALTGLQRKLEFHKSAVKLAKRGNGGRGGIEYRLE